MPVSINGGKLEIKCDGQKGLCRRSFSTIVNTTGREEIIDRAIDNGWQIQGRTALCPKCSQEQQ